ncbi:MAG TPA: translation initiation factor IF-2 [Candidatus Methanofastidiosa archaeon]|nr:translation initiation factor IF-2 [Candidatus Methanofastidiosa archaeon]HPR41839.1 translation initiation factor IF-2 [Candidatus Methanofastidiosa archaeon]
MIRQPIVAILGHVDHGKTTLLDNIRGTKVASREAGGITQHIGATEIPFDVIEKVCGDQLKKMNIPGLLFIDTPGHEAFTTLRSRGGSLADIAVLIVDINEGLQPQTIESINILKQFKTPFIIVLNKIDRIRGWKDTGESSFMKCLAAQNEDVKRELENRIWDFIGKFYEYGFESMRYDKITNFTKNVAIVPASAKTGVGIPEILMLLAGLSQRFLEKRLDIDVGSEAKGTVLEVKEATGFGTTLDVIVYEGTLRIGDIIVLGGSHGIIQTKVRALLKPKPLDEIRDPRFKFDTVSSVSSAAGIKIAAPGLDEALSGSPLLVARDDIEEASQQILDEIGKFRISCDASGVIVKADTLGSLEAIVGALKREKISIRTADIGDIGKKDLVEAMSVAEKNPFDAIILAFNVNVNDHLAEVAKQANIPILSSKIIYKLLEDHRDLVDGMKRESEAKKKIGVIMPGKIQLMPGYVFRNAKPAIVGVEVLAGTIRPKLDLINEKGFKVGNLKAIKEKNEFLEIASKGDQVAVSIFGPTVGRQIQEGEILYIDMPKSNIDKLKELELSPEEEEIVMFLSNLKKKDLFAGWENGD